MNDYPKDLGKCLGCGNTDAWPYNPSDPKEKHYPTLHLDGVEDLPLDGEMTITFHRKEETCKNADGVETCWTCLEVKEILSVKSDKPETEKEEEKNPGQNLNKLLEEMLAKEDSGDGEEED